MSRSKYDVLIAITVDILLKIYIGIAFHTAMSVLSELNPLLLIHTPFQVVNLNITCFLFITLSIPSFHFFRNFLLLLGAWARLDKESAQYYACCIFPLILFFSLFLTNVFCFGKNSASIFCVFLHSAPL